MTKCAIAPTSPASSRSVLCVPAEVQTVHSVNTRYPYQKSRRIRGTVRLLLV